ncbi:mechanosensitive ion channel family protein [Novosphingobium sp. fls2-241-R2A-195]|jgi:MscS family membrane protein|uniref:mechanosensitive ion channel family protein n=1 Tax=Novosphingobium sp. fls2-241-R2A-195 TaxID=3040296 RepID=UPI002551C8D4|nr:mechanosensitive ion channel family protein [Novosphingobium sp. fls2-241-R2A-195]
MLRKLARLWALFLLVLIASQAHAQLLPTPKAEESKTTGTDAATATPAPAAAPPNDPLGRETPRDAVSGLLAALAERDYPLAANYFEARSNGEQLAKEMQAVLDAGGSLLPFGALSNDPAGVLDDGLKPAQERVGDLGDAGKTPILLTHGTNRAGTRIWRIARQTSAAAHTLQPRTKQAEDEGPEIAGASLEDWVRLLGIAALVFLGFQLVNAGLLFTMGRIIADKENSRVYRLTQAAMPPLSLFFATVVFMFWAGSMPVSIVARQLLLRYIGIFAWVALAWFLFRMVDSVSALLISRMAGQERRQAVSVVTLIRRAAKILLLFIAMVAVLDTFGIDVTTGVAALGIGGIALALGAQKTVENLVGSVTLIADKPVQVGDFCKVGEVTGTVEDIGIRSTRIRTLERTVVTIPNGDFSSRQIENYAQRDRFLFNPTIGVEYGIGSAKLLEAVELIESVLDAHDRIIKPGARARFKNFGASSLDIEVFSYIEAADLDQSLVIRQDLLLLIFAALEQAEVGIAFPTSTVHLTPHKAPTTRPASLDIDPAPQRGA